MSNLSTNINLLKLQAKILTIGGEACVCIPIERNDLFVPTNEDGSTNGVFLGLNHWEVREGENQYGHTHLVKQRHSKAYIEKLSEEQKKKKSEPIIGNTKPMKSKETASVKIDAPTVSTAEAFDWNTEFPFPPAE